MPTLACRRPRSRDKCPGAFPFDNSYPYGYSISCLSFRRSPRFEAWLRRIADQKARARIFTRLDQASLGNFGDCKPIGEGVSEMRINFGPGYRLYFVREGAAVYLLLLGGDKSSQKRDIELALAMARKLKQERDP